MEIATMSMTTAISSTRSRVSAKGVGTTNPPSTESVSSPPTPPLTVLQEPDSLAPSASQTHAQLSTQTVPAADVSALPLS